VALFQYTAGANHGTIAADTPRQARDRLRAQGITVEHVAQQQTAPKRSFRSRTSSASKLTSATRELATLLSAGIGLVGQRHFASIHGGKW